MNHCIKIGYCDSPLLKPTFATIEKGGLSIFYIILIQRFSKIDVFISKPIFEFINEQADFTKRLNKTIS